MIEDLTALLTISGVVLGGFATCYAMLRRDLDRKTKDICDDIKALGKALGVEVEHRRDDVKRVHSRIDNLYDMERQQD